MRIALVTDVHFGPPAYFDGKLRKLSDRAPELTRAFVRRACAAGADLIVNLGDVVEDESTDADRERYRQFVQLLAEAGKPVLHVAGNHDQVFLNEADLKALWQHDDALFYLRDIDGLRFVVLNTIETKDVSVRLPEEQLDWLSKALRESPFPVIVLMHHPAGEMDLRGNRWFERAPHICRVAERRQIRNVLTASDKVLCVFNGHAHWNYLEVFEHVPFITLQSLVENLDDDAPGRAAGAWALCDVSRHALQVDVQGEEPVRFRAPRR